MDHWAKEADRLLSDDTLNKALNDIRMEALEALAVTPIGDVNEMLRLQALAAAAVSIRDELRAMIIRQSDPQNETSPFA